MGTRHILAIDQGTTNTKALLVDERAAIVARASAPVEIAFPQPGWVEQDADAIWRSVRAAIDDCLSQAAGARVEAVGLTNQRESVLVWDRATGRPVAPVIVWQCRRTQQFCDRLGMNGDRDLIQRRTGLRLDPLFSAGKIRWILDAIPDGHRRASNGDLCAGTIDSWLIWNLTGGTVHACDATNASRTQLFDLGTRTWDPEMLAIFGVPAAILPDVRPSSGVFGHVARHRPLDGLPIASAIGDSHAALFGHAAFTPGPVKATYGTGSSLMTLVETPRISDAGVSTTIAWMLPDRVSYALEGNITSTGSAVEWLGGILGLPGQAGDVAALADATPDAGGVYLVPAFAGLGAPYWESRARGLICGLSRGTTAAHLARATVESMAFQVRAVFEAMTAESGAASALLADGGASRNDTLMQFQADVLGYPVVRSDSPDVSAVGAAWLAGLAIGVWASTDILAALPRDVSRFEPRMSTVERGHRYDGWTEAVARACLVTTTAGES
jgi:glycerol kinase